LIHLDEC